jgi:dienelactone hydrolase
VLVAAGLWPLAERGAVQSMVTRETDRGDYVVRNVALETLPGLWLTANLYVPARLEGRAPAVLSPHGHWENGRLLWRSDEEVRSELASGGERDEAAARSPLQARCAQLARLGCVVLHYDMVGYGEPWPLGHDDTFTDLESILWGESHLGLQTWNSLRALDWLAAQPNVDAERIGVTGASGGGTQTFLLCAFDERPAAAFPAAMVSSNMQGGCVCENAPHLRVDTTNVEIAALFAPRPLALSAANDWTVDVERKGMPGLREVWSRYRFSVDLHLSARTWPEYGHNYNVHAREFMYAWFDRHLRLGAERPIHEQPFEPIAPAELVVFEEAHPRPEGSLDRDGVRAALRADSEAFAAGLAPADEEALETFRRAVRGALSVLTHTSFPGLIPVAVRELEAHEGRRELVLMPPDGRGELPATLLAPGEPDGTVCVAVSGAGRAALCDPTTPQGAAVRAALERGTTFLLPEVLLAEAEARGEAVALPVDGDRHVRYAGYTWGYNRTLLAERARDVLATIAYARALPGTRRVVVWGEGRAGTRALLAAALAGPAVDGVVVDAGWDFDQVESLADPELLPGALRYGGLFAFAGLCAPGELLLCGREDVPTVTAACYRLASESGRVEAFAGGSLGALDRFLGRR